MNNFLKIFSLALLAITLSLGFIGAVFYVSLFLFGDELGPMVGLIVLICTVLAGFTEA